MGEGSGRGRLVVGELFRLAIVIALTAGGFSLGPGIAEAIGQDDPEPVRLVASVLGALVGYVLGGLVGRSVLAGVDRAQQRVESVNASELVSGVLGAALAGLFGLVVLSPVLVLPGKSVTLPAAIAVLLVIVYAGGRIGLARSGELSRFVGVRGRVEVRSPSRGAGVKIVDSSALIDGRLVEIARAGFLEGTLVVTNVVLDEVQGLADAEDEAKRATGRRGLDTLRTLRDDGLVTVEYAEDDPSDVRSVDGKLAAMCRTRGAALLTTDANLAEVAEVSGVRVLNVNALAEAVRPPAVPGDRIAVRIVKEGTEPRQGVGYLEDGSMVVVERAEGDIGERIEIDVTSITTNRRGRMLFGVPSRENDQ